MKRKIIAFLLATLLATVTAGALAERADRNQPVNIEADRVIVDDRTRTHSFEGQVVLTQGSLVIKGDRLVVAQSADGFHTGIASGGQKGLASFRQKREATDEYVEGEAERIEYDSRNETAKLIGRAWIRAGGDEMRGDFIEYDALTENYIAGSTPSTTGRVRAVLQPKGAAAGDSQ